MPTEVEILEQIKQLGEIAGKVYEYFKDEYASAKMITADVNNLLKQKMSILEEIKQLKLAMDETKKEGDNIIDLAKKEAEGILALARGKLVVISRSEEEAKEALDVIKQEKRIAVKEAKEG